MSEQRAISPGGIGIGTAPGKHCGFPRCNALDFLPFTCDGCGEVYCGEHRAYAAHRCASPGVQSKEVPRCPLCGVEVALKRMQTLDAAVNDHINAGCRKPKQKGSTYANTCSKKGCKKREAIPVTCRACGRNFCLAHRFESDHDCGGAAARGDDRTRAAERRREAAAAASAARKNPVAGSATRPAGKATTPATRFGTAPARGLGGHAHPRGAASSSVSGPGAAAGSRGAAGGGGRGVGGYQGGLTEEEALALALAESAREAGGGGSVAGSGGTRGGGGGSGGGSAAGVGHGAPRPPATGEDADLELALALSASEQEQEQQRQRGQGDKKDGKDCTVS